LKAHRKERREEEKKKKKKEKGGGGNKKKKNTHPNGSVQGGGTKKNKKPFNSQQIRVQKKEMSKKKDRSKKKKWGGGARMRKNSKNRNENGEQDGRNFVGRKRKKPPETRAQKKQAEKRCRVQPPETFSKCSTGGKQVEGGGRLKAKKCPNVFLKEKNGNSCSCEGEGTFGKKDIAETPTQET